jgi:hypothetical protein
LPDVYARSFGFQQILNEPDTQKIDLATLPGSHDIHALWSEKGDLYYQKFTILPPTGLERPFPLQVIKCQIKMIESKSL